MIKGHIFFRSSWHHSLILQLHQVTLRKLQDQTRCQVIMKCFERILLRHVENSLPAGLVGKTGISLPHRGNRSTEDAVSIALHTCSILTLILGCYSWISRYSRPLYTIHERLHSSLHSSNTVLKFADDTTVVI